MKEEISFVALRTHYLHYIFFCYFKKEKNYNRNSALFGTNAKDL